MGPIDFFVIDFLSDYSIDDREQSAKLKRELRSRSDQMIDLEKQSNDRQSRSVELESQLKTMQKMLSISQETENDLKRQLEQTVAQKMNAQEKSGSAVRQLQQLELQNKELQASLQKLDRDRLSLRRSYAEVDFFCLYLSESVFEMIHLVVFPIFSNLNRFFRRNFSRICHRFFSFGIFQLEAEKRKTDEFIKQLNDERSALDKAISAIEKENTDLQHTVQQFQTQLARLEQQHAQK